MKYSNKILKFIVLLIIFSLISLTLISISIIAPATEEEEQWNDPMWYNDQDFSTIIEGSKKNPTLLSDPFFFSLFEENVESNPDTLNNDYDALLMFGQQIGVVFTEGAGIGSYDSMTREIRTKGCIGMECEGKEVLFSAYDISPMINPDGSIYVPELGGEVEGAVISKKGNNLEVKAIVPEGFVDTPNMIREHTATIKVGETVLEIHEDATAKVDETGLFTISGNVYLNTPDTDNNNEFDSYYWVNGESFTIDLSDSATPIITQKKGDIEIRPGEHIVNYDPMIEYADGQPTVNLILHDGNVKIEKQETYLFDDGSKFTANPSYSHSFPDTFVASNKGGKVRVCKGRCYLGEGGEPAYPTLYKSWEHSTIEFLLEEEVVHVNALKGELSLEGNYPYDVLQPPKGLIYIAKHKGSGDVKFSEDGTFRFEDYKQRFHYGVTVDENEYMVKGETDTIMGGSNIVITRPDQEKDTQNYNLDGTIIEFVKPNGKIDIKPVVFNIITNEDSSPYKPTRGVVYEDEPDWPEDEGDPYVDYQPPTTEYKDWKKGSFQERMRILTNPDNYNEHGYGPTSPGWDIDDPKDELFDCLGSGEVCG